MLLLAISYAPAGFVIGNSNGYRLSYSVVVKLEVSVFLIDWFWDAILILSKMANPPPDNYAITFAEALTVYETKPAYRTADRLLVSNLDL